MEKLRISHDTREIISCFYEAQRSSTAITLWQIVNEKRHVLKAFLYDIDLDDRLLKLKWELKPDRPFDKDLTIYFHGQQKSILFKSVVATEESGIIVLKIPSEIRLLELRTYPRIFYSPKESYEVKFRKMTDSHDNANENIKSILLDLSKRGAGVIIPSKSIKGLNLGDKIIITNITNIELKENLLAEIIYTRKIKEKQINQIWGPLGSVIEWSRIGILFNREVSLSTNKDKETIEITAARPQFIGLTPQEQENIINELEKNGHPQITLIKSNTIRLEKLKYLGKEQVRLLTRRCDTISLAKSLQLGTRYLIAKIQEQIRKENLHEFNENLHESIPLNLITNAQKKVLSTMKNYITKNNLDFEL